MRRLWPTWPGMAVPGLWAAYIAYAAATGLLTSPGEVLVALWPVAPLYLGSCLLARWGERPTRPRLGALLAVGVALAALDLAAKAWLESATPQGQPVTVLPGLLALDPTYNVYGTMLRIPGAKPVIAALDVLLVPLSVWGYRQYLARERPVVWGHAAFVGFFAGALAKAGDLIWRGLIVDYLHIPGLPIADLADIYLLWVGAGCVLAASFCYPEAWPDLRRLLPKRREPDE